MMGRFVSVYMDDILIFSSCYKEEHLSHVHLVLSNTCADFVTTLRHLRCLTGGDEYACLMNRDGDTFL